MAYTWSWSFGAETALQLRDELKFTPSAVGASDIAPTQDQQYKPTGGAARHSLVIDQYKSIGYPPSTVSGTNAGVATVAVKKKAGHGFYTDYIVSVWSANSGRHIAAQMAAGAVKLYVDNAFKATSAGVYDWDSWRQVGLAWDMSTGTWKGKVYVDGALVIAEQTDAQTADTCAKVMTNACAQGDRGWYVGQAIFQSAYADVPVNRFVTRVSADADVSETGTWAPDSGTSNSARIGGNPINPAQYTQEATPSANDQVTVGLSANLTNKLGVTPTSIGAVTVHAYAIGLNHTAKAGVGSNNDNTYADGDATTIGDATTYAYKTSTTKPQGNAAWSGSDTVNCRYKVTAV